MHSSIREWGLLSITPAIYLTNQTDSDKNKAKARPKNSNLFSVRKQKEKLHLRQVRQSSGGGEPFGGTPKAAKKVSLDNTGWVRNMGKAMRRRRVKGKTHRTSV
ncbi:hypothetical protein RUM43_008838 [Polyplax serrata]|uniref:Uncharacterized protein n=1 Tax=Polyplax serrata TaxID=468196 RepID=A0AAN8NZ01_POLSC